jgi:multimeric flavodoxin WrbA
MKIIVFNGSPKGETSVTLQSVNYLIKKFPDCAFVTYPIAQQIRKIEQDAPFFDQIIASVAEADAVLWAFPLYFLTVHAHTKRFIELISERGAQPAFAGKYAASLSTSIHFFDHTAHNYLRAVCDDLEMRFVGSFSPDMDDLLTEEGRRQLVQFGGDFLTAIREQRPTQRLNAPLTRREFTYQPGPLPAARPTAGKKVVILHDGDRPGSNVLRMVARCRQNFGEAALFSIQEIDIKASCQGCLRCASRNECAFEGKDGLIDFYRAQVLNADVLIYAGTMVDRYLSARWKMFIERSFFNTHAPVMTGKQIAYVISGPFSQTPNLREMLEGFGEVQRANVVGFVTDEYGDSAQIDAGIDALMGDTLQAALEQRSRPRTFLGVGGEKLFRDEIWGRLRIVFAADHRTYRRLGLYKTFPQANWKQRLLNAVVGPLLTPRFTRKYFDREVKTQMIAPHQKAVEMN